MSRILALTLICCLFVGLPSDLGEGASQVLPDGRLAFGVLSFGARVTNPNALQAELTLQNGLNLWFAVRANPDRRVAPSRGPSLAHHLSTYYLLGPELEVKFLGTFPEPGDRVVLTASLNSLDAALMNILQILTTGLLAMVPGTSKVNPRSLVGTLQAFKDVDAIRRAAMAFVPPPRNASGWARTTTRAIDNLTDLVSDERKIATLLGLFRQVGIEAGSKDLKRLLAADNLRGLFRIIVNQGIFIYATKGREPVVIFTRTTPVREGAYTPAQGSPERQAILDALRERIRQTSGRRVIFRVARLKVQDGWAYMSGDALNPDGTRIEEGGMDLDFMGLLRLEGGRWRVLIAAFCGGIDCDVEACSKFRQAPRSIFPDYLRQPQYWDRECRR